jgi:hypothetical protein
MGAIGVMMGVMGVTGDGNGGVKVSALSFRLVPMLEAAGALCFG